MTEAYTTGQLFAEYTLPERQTTLNKRQYYIQMFVDAINAQRKGTKYKSVTGKGIAMKLAHVKTEDLYWFYQQCKKNTGKTGFSGAFFAKLKVN